MCLSQLISVLILSLEVSIVVIVAITLKLTFVWPLFRGIDLHSLLGLLLTHLNLFLHKSFVVLQRALPVVAIFVSVALQTILRLEFDSRVLLDNLAIFIIKAVVDCLFALAMLSLLLRALLTILDLSVVDEVGHLIQIIKCVRKIVEFCQTYLFSILVVQIRLIFLV